MASDVVLRASGVGKRYSLAPGLGSGRVKDLLEEALRSPLRRLLGRTDGAPRPAGRDALWALRDISFELQRGDVVGLVGRNGSGKSTLLKILSRITPPTEGWVEARGRCGSLLEVGTGFHPDLSGRDNVYLFGSLLSMKRAEIARKFDEIVEFAELGPFIDVPLKRYSTGMQVRLGFAVAAHLEAEILFADEVLAVGDIAFQRKCLDRMEAVASEGRTVIFVSHDIAAMTRLCKLGMWLEAGRLAGFGRAEDVAASYMEFMATGPGQERYWPTREWTGDARPGRDKARLEAVRLLDHTGGPSAVLDGARPLRVELEYEVLADVLGLSVGFHLVRQTDGLVVFHAADVEDPEWGPGPRAAGRYLSACDVPAKLLMPGDYALHIVADVPVTEEPVFRADQALRFKLRATSAYGSMVDVPLDDGRLPPGVVLPSLPWRVSRRPGGASAARPAGDT
ncbi:MAG: ABC transporter ATP-binding protein [Planctomycetes bacterium]|nr:ABC transporter ATP-binding protein [Planctomycetota bacterium]